MFIFFFQAEDGIRDYKVTGVQTCALPIWMHSFILKYWRDWFPRLPSYQTFVLRLNQLEPTFQTFGAVLADALYARQMPELDHLVDSLPVMLAQHGHSYGARVAR